MKTLICIIGPSGSGKTTIGDILANEFDCPRPVGYTTRQPRINEKDGIDYHFVDDSVFETKEFMDINMYSGYKYGVSKDELFTLLDRHSYCHVIISYDGYREYARKLQNTDIRVVSVFIDVSKETCIQRMKQRGDSEQKIQSRIKNFEKMNEFDNINKCQFVILNDDNGTDDIVKRCSHLLALLKS